MRHVFVGAAVALAIAVPAHAADINTITCLETEIGGEGITLLAPNIEARMISGNRMPFPEAFIERLRGPRIACRERHGWTDEATDAALKYTLVRFALPTARRIMVDRGVDPAALEKAYQSLPLKVREAGFDEKFVETFLAQLRVMGIDRPEDPIALGQFIALLRGADLALAEFIRA